MGKGDKRTRRGKIFAGSYGKTRQKPHTPAFVATEKPVVEKAPKKRTPKVVKSAPAPEAAVEEAATAAAPVGTETSSKAPQPTEASVSETSEATPESPQAPPTEEPVPPHTEGSENDAAA